jgi:hypothetical protein
MQVGFHVLMRNYSARCHVTAEVHNASWGGADTRVIGPSRFWVADRRVPEPNEDALKLAPAFHYLPHEFRDCPWSDEEHQRLRESLIQAVEVQPQKNACTSHKPVH